MNFYPVEIKDYIKYKPLLQCDEMTCENSFLNAVLWRSYNYSYAIYEGSLIIRLSEGEKNYYYLPIGGDFKAGVEKIIAIEGGEPTFLLSDGARMTRFLEQYGDLFDLFETPDNFEYIYLQEQLAELIGKKYHQKRNHISSFSRKYEWRFEKMTSENCSDAIRVTDKWMVQRDASNDSELIEERNSIEYVLSYFDELEIVGGIIYVGDEPVTFAFGTALNDKTFDINIEKADSDYPGAYAVINNAFAKELGGYIYLNREDDLGIEGLRKAKLSYYPEIILKKYFAVKKK